LGLEFLSQNNLVTYYTSIVMIYIITKCNLLTCLEQKKKQKFLNIKNWKNFHRRKFYRVIMRYTCLSVSIIHSTGLLASFGQSERILCVVCILSTKHSDPKTSILYFVHKIFLNKKTRNIFENTYYWLRIIYLFHAFKNKFVNIYIKKQFIVIIWLL